MTILLHGVTVAPMINALDKARKRKVLREAGAKDAAPTTAI